MVLNASAETMSQQSKPPAPAEGPIDWDRVVAEARVMVELNRPAAEAWQRISGEAAGTPSAAGPARCPDPPASRA